MFRYGPGDHTELCHAIPHIVELLSEHCEVHYFGMSSHTPIPPALKKQLVLHLAPFHVNRQSGFDKLIKSIFWLLLFPWMGIYCRLKGIKLIFIDDSMPLAALLGLIFFGKNTVTVIADFMMDIYIEKYALLRPLSLLIKKIDLWALRRLPLIFTKVNYTRNYLASKGCVIDRIHPVYDPCDFSIFHPKETSSCKKQFGLSDNTITLVHHGILHPNKGNDFIIKALANLRDKGIIIHYLLIGDGPDMASLKQLVKDLQMNDMVTFTGWLDTLENVNDAINAGDIGLVMRTGKESDNFHVTGALVHSMACGLPILAARLGGVSEIVHENDNGLLFDPNNMEEFQEKLITLAKQSKLRETFGAKALNDARTLFDMDSIARQTASPMLSLIQKTTDHQI